MGLGGGTPPGHTFRKGQDLRPTDEHEPAGPGPAASRRGAGTTAGVLGTRSLPSRRRLAASTAGAGPAGDEPPIWPARIPWGASAAGSGAATTGARRRRFGRRRVARATDVPPAAGALQDACRLATPGCHHAPRGARVTCPRRHRPTRRSVAMTTTSCTPVPMTTSPAPRAARGCSSRPAEARGFRTESGVARPRRVRGGGQRPTEPRASGRLGTTRAGGARGSGDRERPVTLTAAASGRDAATVGRGEAGPECETRERARRRQGAALGVRTRRPHVSVFKRRTEEQGMQQTAGE